ncbi:MAG: hypothetical protein F7B18_01935 [Desulfurococcales archaeon]|nr:hypothetical protein [Desulfurococcales archaeon]
MGRRRKRRVKRQRTVRKPGRYFQCPVCNSMTLTIDFRKADKPGVKVAVVRCGSCGLHCEKEVPGMYERVDVYNIISDLAYEGRIEEECRHGDEGAEEPEVEEDQV